MLNTGICAATEEEGGKVGDLGPTLSTRSHPRALMGFFKVSGPVINLPLGHFLPDWSFNVWCVVAGLEDTLTVHQECLHCKRKSVALTLRAQVS